MAQTTRAVGQNPLGYVLTILGGKWKPYIIWYLSESDAGLRYSELKRSIPFDISHKVFTQQLKELVEEGIIERNAVSSGKGSGMLQVSYSLTEKGRSLSSVVFLLHDWGAVYGTSACRCKGAQTSRGVIGPGRIYYPSHRCQQVGHAERSSLGDVIVWFPEARHEAS